MSRIERRFAALRAEGRAAFVPFVMAADPDLATCEAILAGLPAAGADLIELGVMFSDPMADGPAIQAASLRALKAGTTLKLTLDLVRRFRTRNEATPIVLMGYYNPIYRYGVDKFLADAIEVGIDGLIVVDLPPEEEEELTVHSRKVGLDLIHLTAPTTDDARLPKVMERVGGFVYYVSIAGITGTKSAADVDIRKAVERLRRYTKLPIAVGFGIRTPDQAAAVARIADAAVVGSAMVNKVLEGLDANGVAGAQLVDNVLAFAAELAAGVRRARTQEAAR